MMTVGSQRRARRRVKRSVDELDSDSRARLRRFASGARFVILPTSEAIPLVESRLTPGTVGLSVACTAGLGIDQTIAVSEVLAARGYEVTPHLAARQIRTPRHLEGILRRLRMRSLGRGLVVEGYDGSRGAFPDSARLLAAMHEHPDVPPEIGIAGHPDGHADHEPVELAERLLERSVLATFVSTRLSLNPSRLLGWVAEMRVRGLELPIEAGVPGAVGLDDLLREDPSVVLKDRRRETRHYDPTALVLDLARQPVVDRLTITGLRVETLNRIEMTAAWRQYLYDLSQPARSV